MNHIRKVKYSDYKKFIELLDKEWDLGKRFSKSKGKICAIIYMLEIIRYSDEIIVYCEKEKTLKIYNNDYSKIINV